jgi:UDP-N-acetylmuramoyl-tripeptide--D-alanyl-D-alanine ligase
MHTVELYAIFLKHPVVTTDSRNCPAGSVFFALQGEKFDGNDYIETALQNGAVYAVGDRAGLPNDSRIIRVENVLQSLQDLANYHRKQLNPTLLAITGSNGKTTTKELIATALSTRFPTLFTQGNLNNHIGVPLTLLQLKPEHRFAVIEMGANHPGEIRELCRIADPDFGLITNVGKAHLEGFGSFEGVVRTKGELYDYIREKNGWVFINSDNPVLRERSGKTNTIYYGTSPEAFVQGRMVESGSVLELEWQRRQGSAHRIKTQLAGNYNFENVLAAICVAAYFGVADTQHSTTLLNQALAGYTPRNNRSQHLKTERNHLIIDAYNANPSSMQVALENFSGLKVTPKMVIIGEMKELGVYNAEEHQRLVDRLRGSAFDKVILCGESFLSINSIASEWVIFQHTQELLDYLRSGNFSGFHILIKGSRTNQLEKVIEFL